MGDKNLDWPRYNRLSLLIHLHKIRCVCNFVSILNHDTVTQLCIVNLFFRARKAFQPETNEGRQGVLSSSLLTLPHRPAPSSGSLLQMQGQVYAIPSSSCSSHQQWTPMQLPEGDKRHHSNSPIGPQHSSQS